MRAKNNLTNEQREALAYLERYALYRRMIDGNHHARTYFESSRSDASTTADDALLNARMMEIRHFVVTLPDCREKMLLYYRYIRGHSMETCAELMNVSRRTVFRIAADAAAFAADNFANRETF